MRNEDAHAWTWLVSTKGSLPRRLVRCRHATHVDKREFEFTRVVLLLKLVFACGRTDPFCDLVVVVNFCFHQHDDLDGKVSASFGNVSVSSQTIMPFSLGDCLLRVACTLFQKSHEIAQTLLPRPICE